jgi:hypothetical protein
VEGARERQELVPVTPADRDERHHGAAGRRQRFGCGVTRR